MTLNEYLDDLLGERAARELCAAIADGKTILITGPRGPTGKTTLRDVLKKAGVPAIEQRDVYEVSVQLPLKARTPHMSELVTE